MLWNEYVCMYVYHNYLWLYVCVYVICLYIWMDVFIYVCIFWMNEWIIEWTYVCMQTLMGERNRLARALQEEQRLLQQLTSSAPSFPPSSSSPYPHTYQTLLHAKESAAATFHTFIDGNKSSYNNQPNNQKMALHGESPGRIVSRA